MPNTWINKYTNDPEKRLLHAVAKLAHAVREVSGKQGRSYLRKLEFGEELDGLNAIFQRVKDLHEIPEFNRNCIAHEPGSCSACVAPE